MDNKYFLHRPGVIFPVFLLLLAQARVFRAVYVADVRNAARRHLIGRRSHVVLSPLSFCRRLGEARAGRCMVFNVGLVEQFCLL